MRHLHLWAAQGGLTRNPISSVVHARPRSESEDPSLEAGLTRVEDNELRRLNWMAQRGRLTDAMRERMIELRLRDRRKTIRRPRLVSDD